MNLVWPVVLGSEVHTRCYFCGVPVNQGQGLCPLSIVLTSLTVWDDWRVPSLSILLFSK